MQAVTRNPHAQVAEAYGSLLAEMGDEEKAVSVLMKVVALSPEEGHEKYLYLGQLLEGEEAVTMTRKGSSTLN
jgi:Flp pilus assembly protein TadD